MATKRAYLSKCGTVEANKDILWAVRRIIWVTQDENGILKALVLLDSGISTISGNRSYSVGFYYSDTSDALGLQISAI